jgi:hypothetical protein
MSIELQPQKTVRPKRNRQKVSGNCVVCGIFRKSLHKDHIVPLFKGGLDVSENLQYLCANCHEDKSSIDFIGYQHTAATKAKLSQIAQRPRGPYSDAHKASLSQAAKKRWQRPEYAERNSAARKGIKRSLETCNKIKTARQKWVAEQRALKEDACLSSSNL